MTIRDKFRRAIRRSAPASSSSSSSSASSSTFSLNASSATSASSASSPDASSKRSSYRLAMTRSFPWGSGSRGRSDAKKESAAAAARRGQSPDPREKPFTEINLKYQQMFEPYTMTFGTTRSRSSFEDESISPRTSRRNSLVAPDQV